MATRPHLPSQFENDIAELKNKIMEMGGLVEEAASQVIAALVERDNTLLPDLKESEERFNTYEVEIDAACVEALALRQPMAMDLRMIVTVSKIAANLERMGDEMEHIVRFAKESSLDSVPADISKTVGRMGKKVLTSISNSMDCFSRLDSTFAKQIVEEDAAIDAEYKASLHELLLYVTKNPQYMVHVLNVMWCARALERIADHSKNIAEYVIFIDQAVDVRHGHDEVA